jgi:hypothetical protein
MRDGKDGGRLGLERRQVLQVVVDRLQRPVRGVPENQVHPAFQLAGEHADAQFERFLQIGLHLRQHRQTAGHMKAADHHRHTIGTERAGDIERAGILIRLNADDPDQAESVVTPKQGAQLLDFDAGVDLVDDRDVDGGVGPEHRTEPRIPSEAIEHGERVRRNECSHPLDDIAIVVVMRRLNQNELKPPRRCTHHAVIPPLPARSAGGSSQRPQP